MNIQALNTSRLAPLFPPLIQRANNFIADCAEEGVTILITQGLRTWKQQDALWAQGRLPLSNVNSLRATAMMDPIGAKDNELKVTNAHGGQSYHNFGLAFDIVPIDAKGKPIWDTNSIEWKIAQEIGELHPGSPDTRLDPAFVAKVVAQDLGLSLGADFSSIKDIPHYELTGGVSLQMLKSLFKPNDLRACWREVQMRI